MARLLTINPGFIPCGYFDEDNVSFLQNKIAEILNRRYTQRVVIPKSGIVRIMQRVLSERIESIPKMNERVLMYMANDFMTHQDERDKHMKWSDASFQAHQIVDLRNRPGDLDQDCPSAMRANTDVTYAFRFANRLGTPKVGNTLRFNFTY
jgi:hypothetical protein